MKTLRFTVFALLLGVSLVTAMSMSTGLALAHGPDKSLEGGDNKIIVNNIPAGDSIVIAQNGALGHGLLSEIGGSLETFTKVGTPTQVYLFDANRGLTLLGQFTATSPWPDSIFSAASPMVGMGSKGVASPMSPNQGMASYSSPSLVTAPVSNCGASFEKGEDQCRHDVNGKKLDQ